MPCLMWPGCYLELWQITGDLEIEIGSKEKMGCGRYHVSVFLAENERKEQKSFEGIGSPMGRVTISSLFHLYF